MLAMAHDAYADNGYLSESFWPDTLTFYCCQGRGNHWQGAACPAMKTGMSVPCSFAYRYASWSSMTTRELFVGLTS